MSVVDLAGVAVQLHASDAARSDAIASLFRHAATASHPAECTLEFSASEVGVPAEPPASVVAGLRVWRPAPGQLVVRSPSGLTAAATVDHIQVGGDARDLAREFRYVATLALTHVLAHHGRHVLHAAAVSRDERAVLVLGGTGMGKSTLVLAALESGWRALSDDLVAVRVDDGVLQATGLPRPVSVPLELLRDERAAGLPVPGDTRNRVELPDAALTQASHPLAAVIQVAHGAEPTVCVEPIAAHDALRAVVASSVSLVDPALRRELFAVGAALARLPAWSLRHGSDVGSRVEQAALGLDRIHGQLVH